MKLQVMINFERVIGAGECTSGIITMELSIGIIVFIHQCHRRMLIVMLNNLAQTLKIRVNLVAMLVMFLFMMHTGNEQLENVVWTISRNVYVKHVTAELSGAVRVGGAE